MLPLLLLNHCLGLWRTYRYFPANVLFLKRQHWQNIYRVSRHFSVSVWKFFLSLFALCVLCSCCLYSKWRQDNEKGESLPRCFGFQFVTMAAAATSCQSGSSCVHSFLCARSRGVTKRYVYIAIYGVLWTMGTGLPQCQKRPWTLHTCMHTYLNTHFLKAFAPSAITIISTYS